MPNSTIQTRMRANLQKNLRKLPMPTTSSLTSLREVSMTHLEVMLEELQDQEVHGEVSITQEDRQVTGGIMQGTGTSIRDNRMHRTKTTMKRVGRVQTGSAHIEKRITAQERMRVPSRASMSGSDSRKSMQKGPRKSKLKIKGRVEPEVEVTDEAIGNSTTSSTRNTMMMVATSRIQSTIILERITRTFRSFTEDLR